MMHMSCRPAIVLFDGECSFCSRSVQFIIGHDPSERFKFTPSQADVAGQIKAAYHIENVTGTMILIQNGQAYTHSDAALRIASQLSWPWCWAKGFLIIPGCLRNSMYKFISHNRHRLGGGKQSCMMPIDAIRKRFEIQDSDWQ